MRVPLIYKEAPTFGFDIGSRTVKLVQVSPAGKKRRVIGYGSAEFPADAIIEGIISDPEALGQPAKALLAKASSGHIASRRVVAALPAAKIFIRPLQLPHMDRGDIEQAIRFEAEQYVPVPITDLYIDYEVINQDKAGEHIDVLMVAAPRAIVDSYIKLFDYLGLEIEALDTSLGAIVRALETSGLFNGPTLVVDFGSRSIDMAVFDNSLRLTGSVPFGGDDFTQSLVKDLAIKPDQANEIKYKFGLGSSDLQAKIQAALAQQLKTFTAEVKKIDKFYQDRSESHAPVAKMILTGGSARLPGLIEFLTKELGIEVIIGDPWINLNQRHLEAVKPLEAPAYTTAIGLALRNSE